MRVEDLAGRWRVARVIRHTGGGAARFEGLAEWLPEGASWRCVETGRLSQGGGAFEARRETLWRQEGEAIVVAFGDGRPFHRFWPALDAEHDCPPDDYRLRYDVSAWPAWSVRWRVTGPRKDYRALTRYSRP
ncbi:DUF6314 family protein [Jannaschia seohaensis]|uniref:DUF6314 domain-containing protein n=1 Tax=Jannaschia seohaensis TaxID=475081 RepID=A0A2Y9C5K4_9RHOB|nr:DUF6314 family protein [Jannaschia seohaensis]PWJ21063.1 hypothetical protein BCF38_102311 [Jannaschia seohaensis]SSA41473.1 hypothetical protein SAMN05421539_102311 [Jannaschia seohaensis]